MKDKKRTTIRMDNELRVNLRIYCLDNGKTMDSVISHAIEEKICRDTGEEETEVLNIDSRPYSLYALYFLDNISSILGIMTARRLFDMKCRMFKIQPELFSKENLTPEFIDSFCSTFSLIARKECVEKLKIFFEDILRD